MRRTSTAEAWRPESDRERRILIVDDDPDFADALAEMLSINDFLPRVAHNPDEAASVAAEFAPALALVDIRLGQQSGLDQIERLRRIDDSMICVMITAYADTQTAIEALRRGADDFLRKPLRPEDALTVMYRCLGKQRLETQKRLMEIRLASMQKSETVARLTSGVAHEFNNLLTVILGNLHFLSEDIEEANGPQGPQRAKWIDAIERSATHGAKLTRQLLAYARKQPLTPRPVDLSEAVTSLRELLDASLGEEIRIGLVLPGGLWPVHTDPAGLEEALINLGLNARDALRDGGMLTITLENRSIDRRMTVADTTMAPGDYVAISMADDGDGMPEEVRVRAFEPFFSTRSLRESAGLGLSMVHNFAAESGGGVDITSKPGGGTTVTLYLPRALDAETEDAAPENAAPPPAAEGGNAVATTDAVILVVEDDPDVRLLATTLLRDMGHRCITAESGVRALRMLEDGIKVDLLFTDIVMPGGISGHVLGEEAVKRRPGLRVVFTSGNSGPTHTTDADRSYFLHKPYDRETLRTVISAALNDAAEY